ncbi:hypothetical protein TNCT_82651 [Trichonephila clavata]|uniref:Uncharacterized protein n=1 Tax=Trichonephila clavata TaxID=2740835 RepID=A0A8X6H8C2_TRICU|nr:hypothetical protein TNCT_82651 [Trichonephila clavata]
MPEKPRHSARDQGCRSRSIFFGVFKFIYVPHFCILCSSLLLSHKGQSDSAGNSLEKEELWGFKLFQRCCARRSIISFMDLKHHKYERFSLEVEITPTGGEEVRFLLQRHFEINQVSEWDVQLT